MQTLACFHCGLPVLQPGRWLTRVDGETREMCCAGCQAVAQSIEAAGLTDYYRHRSAPAAGPDAVPRELAEQLALYDEPDVQSRIVRQPAEGAAGTEVTLLLEGMRCGACVWLIERTLAAQPGVLAASVNFATERAVLRWDPATTRLSTLLADVAAVGYRALPYDARRREAQLASTSRSLFRRLFVAGLGMMQVMMYAFPVYTAQAGDIEWQYEHLMRWASLLLTTPVVFYSAQPFFAGAWRDLKARSLGMDVPVALGIGAAFAASLWATLVQRGDVYFDSVTMFVFLLLAARHLEWMARRRASRAVDSLAAALPERVERLTDASQATAQSFLQASTETIPSTRLVAGDLIRVGDGLRFPVDVSLLAGDTAVDQSLLTGESAPVPRGPGDEVPGGAINSGNTVLARVLRGSADSTVSTLERLIERAAQDKPAVAQLADRVASWFVLGLLLFAAVVLAAWWWIDPSRALPIAIAVLVVSCPCALSLATPAALAAASGALTRHGVLVANGRALENLAVCTDVVFDKTGTLTRGRPEVAQIEVFRGHTAAQVLGAAAALEAGSAHPLAGALRQAARAHPPLSARQVHATAGRGIQGWIGDDELRLGSSDWCSEWVACPRPEHGDSEIWLVDRSGPRARLRLADALREDSAETVRAIRALGLRTHLLTGDHQGPAARVADALGIESVCASATPAGKLAYVRELQAQGRRVLMVGDGVNDAPVLAAADASVAVGEATALARTAADSVLLSSELHRVVDLVSMARRTRLVIAQNLAWSTAYNFVAIPAAALGYVPPWLAAIGMSTSSLLVVGNALRLRIRTWNRSTSSSR